MSQHIIQLANHACTIDDRPPIVPSSSSSSPSLNTVQSSISKHTKHHHHHHSPLLIGPSTTDYPHPQPHGVTFQHPPHPPSQHSSHHQNPSSQALNLEARDTLFELPSLHPRGLLPMPVAYEAFMVLTSKMSVPHFPIPGASPARLRPRSHRPPPTVTTRPTVTYPKINSCSSTTSCKNL